MEATASPGDYSLRLKAGPGFELNDWHNQFRLGGEFDYDLGYSMHVGMLGLFGVSSDFRFQLIPSFRYDVLYVGPATIYGIFGGGYGRYNSQNGFDIRMGSGLILPLGGNTEVTTTINVFVTPAGTPGTPVTLDWLLGFGYKFR